MGYVRTAGMSTAARRARRRAALVITGLLAVLALVLVLSMAYVQGWFGMGGGTADDPAATTAAPVPGLTAEDVVVNVFNSTGTSGLAGRAGDALRSRGFTVDGVGNSGAEIEGAGQLVYGAAGAEGAQLLADALPVELEMVQDDREDESVDLILGDAWEDLPAPESTEGDG